MAHDKYFADTYVHEDSDLWLSGKSIIIRDNYFLNIFSFDSFEYENFWQVEYANFDMTAYDSKVEISATALLIQDTDIYHVKFKLLKGRIF